MASVHNDVLDSALNYIKNNATAYHLCSSEPTTRAETITASLASVSVSSSDFTVADGDISGRKVTVAQKSGTVSTGGSATHAAIIDGTRLLVCTTVTAQTLTGSNPVTFPAWDYELRDP